MPLSRHTKTARLRMVAAARAGIIPASDNVTDEARTRLRHAASLVRAMRRVAGTSSRASDEIVITNILADLRYYCATKGWSFKQLDLAAEADHDDWQSTLRSEGVCTEP